MPATTAQTAIAAITALSFRKSISTSAATTVRNAIIGPSNIVPITAKPVVQSRTLLIEQSPRRHWVSALTDDTLLLKLTPK